DAAPEWDKRVSVLQLTDVTERTIQIRVLVSARSSGLAFDLRCRVREALVTFIQREYPDCLPQVRMPVDARSPIAGTSNLGEGL
ncbi:MAG: mechanosensitive ion channel family protein, partial [Alcaligenaceae bacterium]